MLLKEQRIQNQISSNSSRLQQVVLVEFLKVSLTHISSFSIKSETIRNSNVLQLVIAWKHNNII